MQAPIPVNNGEREKSDKLPAENCQDNTEEYSVSVSFYCICVSAHLDSAGTALSYRQGAGLPPKQTENKSGNRKYLFWAIRQYQLTQRLHRG